MADDTSHALTVLHETVGAPAEEKAISATTGQWQPNYWETLSEMMGFSAMSDKPLSGMEALQLAAVLVCLDIISQDIAKTPRYLRRKLPDGGSEIVKPKEHWLAEMLELEPNDWMTWNEFVEMTMFHLALTRNAFIAKRFKDRTGQPDALMPIMPGRVQIDVNSDSTDFIYRTETSTYRERVLMRGFGDVFTSERMIHIRGRVFDGLNGYSTLQAGAKAMGLVQEVTDFQRRMFKNDGSFRGVFQAKEDITVSDTVFQRLRTQLAEAMNDLTRKAKPLVLEGGIEWKGIQQTNEQAETVKARSAAIIDVFRLFRVPPHKAMQLEAVKYENLEQMEKAYVSDTLIPYCRQFEQRMDRGLLTREERLQGYFLQHDREAMSLQDAKAHAEIWKVGLMGGAVTIDEYRSSRGLNPLKNGAGKVRLIPSTYSVVDDKNAVVIPAGGQNNQAAAPEPDDAAPKKSGEVVTLRAVE